jgi:hypothetical protein
VFEPLVGAVYDLVDRERCSRTIRILGVMGGQVFGDFGQPFVKLCFGACVQCGKRADDACFALCKHQCRIGNDKQWRSDHGNAQPVFQNIRQCHLILHKIDVSVNVIVLTWLLPTAT